MKFLRYPGGKRKLLSFLGNYLPANYEIKGKYIEPFVGGGSVFFFMQPHSAILSDLNKELIDLYKAFKNYPKKVWEIFNTFPRGKKSYYEIRNESQENKPIYYRAARTLYLNRTCFKGMWRHNPEGQFNVGYGGEARRHVLTLEDFIELTKRLKKAIIVNADFEKTLDMCSDGDFIFLDPPYKPGSKDMNQAHYINGYFSFDEQIRLANKLKRVSQKRDIKWLMTNSSHLDIRSLYKGFNIVKVPKGTSSVIGVFSNNSQEILISNY